MLIVLRHGALDIPRFSILDGLFSRHTTSSSLSLQSPLPSIARSCHRRASPPVNQRDARRSESTHPRNNCLPLYSSCALSHMIGQIRMLPGRSLHRPTLVYADIMILLGSCYACAWPRGLIPDLYWLISFYHSLALMMWRKWCFLSQKT